MLNVKENSFLYINIIYLNRFCNPELKSYIFVFHSFCVFRSIILKYIIHRDWHSADLVTMADRGRMKLCILQVLCMYFSVTVIFIFISWSKTQKEHFIFTLVGISHTVAILSAMLKDKFVAAVPCQPSERLYLSSYLYFAEPPPLQPMLVFFFCK